MFEKEIAARLAGKSSIEAYNLMSMQHRDVAPKDVPRVLKMLDHVKDTPAWHRVLELELAKKS